MTDVSPVFGNSLAEVVGGNFLAVLAEVSVVVTCERVFESVDCGVASTRAFVSLDVVVSLSDPVEPLVVVTPFDDT